MTLGVLTVNPSVGTSSSQVGIGQLQGQEDSEDELYQLLDQLCPPDLTSELPGTGAAELTGLPDTDGSATHKDSDPPQPGPGSFTHPSSRLPARCCPSPSLR